MCAKPRARRFFSQPAAEEAEQIAAEEARAAAELAELLKNPTKVTLLMVRVAELRLLTALHLFIIRTWWDRAKWTMIFSTRRPKSVRNTVKWPT